MKTTSLAIAAAFVLAAVISPRAAALPRPASGANCSSDWVNNAAAMQCFTKGEEETHAGAAHPHYVACLNGQIYCCVDDSRGQNCDAVESKTRATSNDWMKALLAAHRAQAKRMSPIPSSAGKTRQP